MADAGELQQAVVPMAAQAMYVPNIPTPETLNVESKDLAKIWIKWKEELELYLDIALEHKTEQQKVKMVKYLLGSSGREVYNTFQFGTDEQHRTVAEITAQFDAYCDPRNHEIIDRHNFFTRKQDSAETIDKYATALRMLAKHCNFGDLSDSLIRDRIVCGIANDALREKLLRERDLNLNSCIRICRASEVSKEQNKTFAELEDSVVHAVQYRTDTRKKHAMPNSKVESSKTQQIPHTKRTSVVNCRFCGEEHERRRDACPAFGKECPKCHRMNHSANKCYREAFQKSRVHRIDDGSDDSGNDYLDIKTLTFDSVNAVGTEKQNQLYATMLVNNQHVRFQVDSGATCNIIPDVLCNEEALRSMKNTSNVLTMYDGSTLTPRGTCPVKLCNPKTGTKYKLHCVVLDVPCTPIIGNTAAQRMGLIKVNYEHIMSITQDPVSKDTIIQDYSDVFEGTGLLKGGYHIRLDDSIPPVVHKPRRIPLSLKGRLKDELSKLCKLGVLSPVYEPTPWVSSLVMVEKGNKLRICIDPKDLNRSIQRSHYPLPTLDDVLPKLSAAKIYSVLDARNGFWHVQLDKESSLLTTFNTPFGRYRWLRMPFGIASAPEEFQRRQDQALEGLPGVLCIADDILVYGEGEDMDTAIADHDRKLVQLLQRCRQCNLKLNKEKLRLRLTEVKFVGHILSNEGLKPDPQKIQAVVDMPRPTDVPGVQRCMGIVNYLAKFMPHLSNVTAPLRILTHKGQPWIWSKEQESAFKLMKQLITTSPILSYYDSKDELVLQCDASQKGLGACMMQNEHPVAYTSRALTDCEARYAQIEKELLAITFGVQRFHQYTYGRKVIVHTDHKPLINIFQKSLHQAPQRLQRMLLRIQAYDIDLHFKPGKLMFLADTLSRAPLANENQSDFEKNLQCVNVIDLTPISKQRIDQIGQHTAADDSLQNVAQYIEKGWPKTKKDVSDIVRPYWDIHGSLTVVQGIIFYGDRAVIPTSLRPEMLQAIHASHVGIDGCLRRARESLFWPGMSTDVKIHVGRCETCCTFQVQQQRETLHPHEVPTRPWAKVGTDLFTLNDRSYLVTVDYYSNFWEVDYLQDTTSSTVIHKLKGQFARHGIPDTCISDNGPQYSSAEFKQFANKWHFDHITSSPAYPQSNGKAEQSVKMIKNLMKKAHKSNSDVYLAMLDFRNTPTQGMTSSPAQRLFARRTKTLLPTCQALLEPKVQLNVDEEHDHNQTRMAKYYNANAKDLPRLEKDDSVRIQPTRLGTKEWEKAVVVNKPNIRSYNVLTERNQLIRRNRRQLRKTDEPQMLEVDNQEPEPTANETQNTVTQPEPLNEESVDVLPEMEPTARQTRSGRKTIQPAYLKDYVSK